MADRIQVARDHFFILNGNCKMLSRGSLAVVPVPLVDECLARVKLARVDRDDVAGLGRRRDLVFVSRRVEAADLAREPGLERRGVGRDLGGHAPRDAGKTGLDRGRDRLDDGRERAARAEERDALGRARDDGQRHVLERRPPGLEVLGRLLGRAARSAADREGRDRASRRRRRHAARTERRDRDRRAHRATDRGRDEALGRDRLARDLGDDDRADHADDGAHGRRDEDVHGPRPTRGARELGA